MGGRGGHSYRPAHRRWAFWAVFRNGRPVSPSEARAFSPPPDRPIDVTWWHLEALAARLAELLPAQLEFTLEGPVEAAERAVEAPGGPHAPSRPQESLGTAPGPRKPVEHDESAQGSGCRQAQTGQSSTEENPQGDWSEVDIALWPLLYGPRGILGRRRRGRRPL
jgi:hypothetical protein